MDDNRDAADSLGVLLDLLGCEAHVCYDGPAALAMVGSFSPEVCLLDLSMPGMDGCELSRRVRAALPERPVRFVAVTAMDGADARCRIAAAGFDAHLVKPVDPKALLSAVCG